MTMHVVSQDNSFPTVYNYVTTSAESVLFLCSTHMASTEEPSKANRIPVLNYASHNMISVPLCGKRPALMLSTGIYMRCPHYSTAPLVAVTDEPDALYRKISVLVKGHDKAVLDSYEYFIKHLTGSSANVYLEYIQRNLPEGVAMEVTKTLIEKLPEHIKEPIWRIDSSENEGKPDS
ncbi:probable 28S ribosomal protein S10, mitochondrial [Chiloscyllium plagiosum]|uniref:probable 28S ribosomal protein S10, mitochondrial n=1 Tax=Chiloscyllium plagiosum TaxID=36176 RepID=UPI001CB84F91|nr:probable 28S ribosomal protein S10, mitochondrial [Chiloscyllium plagiosum]